MSTPYKNKVTDVIVILDESGSMISMGNEPVQSVNAFMEEQRVNDGGDESTFTLVTFNNTVNIVIDHVPLAQTKPMCDKDYNPTSGTALNDAICSTINNEKGINPKVVVIITDGYENSSNIFKPSNTRSMIKNAEDNLGWKFIFMGANINVQEEGSNININEKRCLQFNQSIPGDLLLLSRRTSTCINKYRQSRSEG